MNSEIVSKSKIISLHSIDGEKQNGDFNSNILFNFVDVIKRHSNTLYLTIAIQSVEIPYSFYNVSTNYNTIYYSVGGAFYTMTIPEGNYTAKTFITEFNSQFALGGHSKTATLSISKSTGKFTLTPSDDTFSIIIYYEQTTATRILGLNENTTFNYNGGVGNTFSYPANLLGTQKIKIFSNALSCDNISSFHLGSNDLIDVVSVNASPFELINYSNTNIKESHMTANNVQQIDIVLKDEYNNEIDFNGIDWSISLVITEYLLGENIRPFGDFDDIFLHTKKMMLQKYQNPLDQKKEKKKDEPFLIDKTLQFLTDS